MKTLTVILLLFSAKIFAQQIPKNADVIILNNNKTASENFIYLKQQLVDKGFEIALADKDVFQIKTGEKPVNKWVGIQYFLILCKDKQIILRGFLKSGIEENSGISIKESFRPIINRKGGIYPIAWNSLNEFAKSLEGEISYSGGEIEKPKKSNDDAYN